MQVQIKRLRPDAVVPRYMSHGAAGLDLHAAISTPVTIKPGHRALVGTGLSVAIPLGAEGQVRPRSGLALRKGLTVLNAPGTIDADYRGEIKIVLINHDHDSVVIDPGDRIAQLVIAPVLQASVVEVDVLDETARGHNGFGSTG